MTTTLSYQAALDWLFTRTRAGAPRTSARATQLLANMRLAPPPLTAVVVGTNGKGSVTTMLASGLSASGMRTGRFLSPHVEAFEERISVDGKPVTREAVVEFVATARALDAVWPFGEETRPAFFEWTLALALSEFAKAGTSAGVLEAGVGGGHDATRAVDPVSLTVLTNVDLDHLDALGPTLETIAQDKVGAFRQGVPIVCGAEQPEVVALVREAARALGAPLYLDAPSATDAQSSIFTLPPAIAAALAHPGPTSGIHQANRRANARLAAAGLRLLGADEAAVAAGLGAPSLPARLERFSLPCPSAGKPDVLVVLDGAHDPAAARRLVAELPAGYVLVFGSLARKQGAQVLQALVEGAHEVIVTEAAHGEGAPPHLGARTFVADTEAALDLALTTAASTEEPRTVLIAGSLYLAGLIRPLLRARGRRLPDAWEAEEQYVG